MIFNTHSRLAGSHAFLSASNYHWINYDEEKLDAVYIRSKAAQDGIERHALAAEMIRLGVKAQGRTSFASYVNDAIGFRMNPEQILYYSENCYGTADAVSFKRGKLRIHDLKTGVSPASVHQLEVYAGLFCLEYRVKPADIDMEFRIYQSDEVKIYEGDPNVVTHIMDKIVTFNKRIDQLKMEAK